MANSPDTPDQPAGPQGHAADQRDRAGSVTNTQAEAAASGSSRQLSGAPRLQGLPPALRSTADPSGRRIEKSPAEAPPSGPTTGRPPSNSVSRPPIQAAPTPSGEEELLPEDEEMIDAVVLPSAAATPAQEEEPAGRSSDTTAATPPLTTTPAESPTGSGSVKRKKRHRGGRRHRRKISRQADVPSQRDGAQAPRAAASTPTVTPTPASRGKEKSSLPAYAVSRLPAWDKLPARQRRVYATQERRAFRKDGVLVSRFDIPLYYAVSRFNAGGLYSIFPRAPKWWPGDWGDLPVTLPWEVCLYRSRLIAADGEDALWGEVYQKFLEQLALGWDLHFQETDDRSQIAPLPDNLVTSMLQGGAFAFAAGPPLLPSLEFFLKRHDRREDPADQRLLKADVWERIQKVRAAQEQSATLRKNALACDCSIRLARAVRRVGLESKLLEATPDLQAETIIKDQEKLAALAAAALHYGLGSDGLLGDMKSACRSSPPEYALERLQDYAKLYAPLYEALPRHFWDCYNRTKSHS